MNSSFRLRIFATLIPLFVFFESSSQCIDYVLPDTFFVCQSAFFEVIISNADDTPMQNIEVSVDFTTESGVHCGIRYLPGSVTGATEANIANLEKPVFQIPDLPPDGVHTFIFEVFAPCSARTCIDDAEIFKNIISLNASNCEEETSTLPYVVETANLLISSIAHTYMEGSQGDILTRTIKVRNTRPGSVTRLVFTDAHQGGIKLTTDVGEVLFSDNVTWRVELDADDFQVLGIGSTFDFMESLTITEAILITACGFDTTSTISEISIEWGCDNEFCQIAQKQAAIGIKPSTLVPDLVFEPVVAVPECFCGPDPVPQGMKITNFGDGPAIDILLFARQLAPNGGIDFKTVRMDSAGMMIPLKGLGIDGGLLPNGECSLPGSLFYGAGISIPRLEPGVSVTVYWDVYICQFVCNSPAETWEYTYQYYKLCPPHPLVQSDTMVVSELGDPLSVTLGIDKTPLMDGETYTLTYEIDYAQLSETEDSLVLAIRLLCGMTWDPANTLEMNGQTPHIYSPQQLGDTNLIIAKYDLPFSSDVDSTQFSFMVNCEGICFNTCRDSLTTSCSAEDSCAVGTKPGATIFISTYIQECDPAPFYCGVGSCNSLSLTQECYDSICVTTIPGYVSLEFETERVNFGRGDNDNDHFPDGDLNMNLIRKDRLIVGDTFGTSIRGVVVVDEPGLTFSEGYVDINIGGSDIGVNNTALLSPDGIVPAYSNLKVYDKSEDAWYECDDPSPVIRSSPLRYGYKLTGDALLDCGGPPDFELEDGDSIIFDGGYRIEYNLLRSDPAGVNWALMALLRIRPRIPVFNQSNTDIVRDTLFDCGCGESIFEVSAIDVGIEPGVFAFPACDTSELVGASLFQIELHEPNFFPYEYRNITKLIDWQLKMPPGIEPLEELFKYIRFQDGINYLEEEPLTPIVNGENYTYILDYFQEPYPPEEGFFALFQYRFVGDCMLLGSFDMEISSRLDFADGMEGILDTLLLTNPGVNSLRSLIPNLSLIDPLFVDTTQGNQNILDFEIVNIQTMISSQMSRTAENVWLFPISPTGQIKDFVVVNKLTGDTVPVTNGIFQLDTIAANDTLPFRLIALNENCEDDKLTIRYGWNCTPFTNPINIPCYVQEKTYEIITFPGVLDMFVTSPEGCSDLCDTIPYHTIQIFNAERGSVFDLMLAATIPTGVGVIPGTSEIEYPAGSGNFFPVADPLILGGNKIQWNVLDELSGIESEPAHIVNLRFLGMDSCSFVSGGYPVFTASGRQNCDAPTNRISKPGDPLCTNGIIPPYTTNLEIGQTPEIECHDEVTFTVSIEATGVTQPGDCVIVEFPPGISYVDGSCVPIQPGFSCDCEVQNNRMVCQLPAGISPGSLMAFQFDAEGFDSLGCEPEFMVFQTASQTIANCIAIGDTCSTKVGTGFLLYELKIERPAFDLANFDVIGTQTTGDDLVNFSIEIANVGDADAFPPTIVDFYLDTNGDGLGDVLVHSASYSGIIEKDGTVTLASEFEIPAGNLCRLIALIDPEKHCACATDILAAPAPFIYILENNFIACSGETIEIGVTPEAGNDYQWTGGDLIFLECETCPLTNFSKINDGILADTLLYTLIGSDNMGCLIENRVTVIVQPEPGIVFATSPICLGQSANICATDGIFYNWEGPGVIQGLTCQTVSPASTAEYRVTITDSEGCQGSDMVTVVVHNLPLAFAGNDTIFCPMDVYQLGGFFDPGYQYQWSAGPPFLDNPAIFNPTVLMPFDTTLTLTVTDENGCQNTDEIQISFSPYPEVTVLPSGDTICLGDTHVLESSGAISYEWTPEENCLDPNCSMMEISPENTTTYTVVGTNAAGCLDTAFVTIFVETDTTVFQPPMEICQNDSLFLFGNWVNQPGAYCDTLVLNSGCKNVTCVEVTVLPVPESVIDSTICRGDSVQVGDNIYTESGNYTDVFSTQNGCDSLVRLDLAVIDIPKVEITGPGEVPFGDPVELSVEDLYDTYDWLANDEDLAGCFGSPDCTHDFPAETTVYTVFVTRGNCPDSAVLAVTVVNFCAFDKVEIPTAFTPDGDGMNDTFSIVQTEEFNQANLISLEIWSRWGEKIYEGTGDSAFWDGTYKGKPAASDVYVYIIFVGCSNEVNVVERYVGDVTLLR